MEMVHSKLSKKKHKIIKGLNICYLDYVLGLKYEFQCLGPIFRVSEFFSPVFLHHLWEWALEDRTHRSQPTEIYILAGLLSKMDESKGVG